MATRPDPDQRPSARSRGSEDPPHDIAPEELDLTIARLREAIAGLSDDQLVKDVARVFGFDRTGGRIRAVLEARLAPSSNGSGPSYDGERAADR